MRLFTIAVILLTLIACAGGQGNTFNLTPPVTTPPAAPSAGDPTAAGTGLTSMAGLADDKPAPMATFGSPSPSPSPSASPAATDSE